MLQLQEGAENKQKIRLFPEEKTSLSWVCFRQHTQSAAKMLNLFKKKPDVKGRSALTPAKPSQLSS